MYEIKFLNDDLSAGGVRNKLHNIFRRNMRGMLRKVLAEGLTHAAPQYELRLIRHITGPRCQEGSRKLRFPDYVTLAQNGGKVISLTHRPFLTPGNTLGIHFC